MTTTTLILGLKAATFLPTGGYGGFVFGSFATAFGESFDIEDGDEGVTSDENAFVEFTPTGTRTPP